MWLVNTPMETQMSRIRSKDGTPIAFDRRGDGPPLVLVDGALCWREFGPSGRLAELLGTRFTVFTYDRRGRGESGDAAPYATEREVEDLQAVIEEAGGSAYVSGISSGAVLALEAAARGASIERLALYEAPFIVDNSRAPVPVDIVAQLEELLADGRRGDAVRLFLRQVGAPGIVVSAMRFTPMWRQLTAVAHTLPYDMTIVGDKQQGRSLPAERWRTATMSALALVGGKSPTWLHQGMRALAEALPNARFKVLRGQTHNVKPKALAPKLAEFFGEQGSSGERVVGGLP
jgi:pimeloyl-ACP methyl ester carboxylesterase